MTAKHTPGPWQTQEHYNESVEVTDARGFVIVEATSMPILLGWHEKLGIAHWADKPGEAYLELTPEEQAANARLIAAAPELLDALILADAMLSGANMNANVVEKKVRAAIAKATGEAA